MRSVGGPDALGRARPCLSRRLEVDPILPVFYPMALIVGFAAGHWRGGMLDDGLSFSFRSFAEFQAASTEVGAGWAAGVRRESEIIKERFGGPIPGFSVTADTPVDFDVSWGEEPGPVNWRESLICPVTGIGNRVRAAYHFLSQSGLDADSRIYTTEQATAFFQWLSGRQRGLVGSEYLDGVERGASDDRGLRCEDLTALTFEDGSFDFILTFDVFEHVPDYKAALRECARVLKPGGRMFMTVPFGTPLEDTLVRARLREDGSIEHLREPEYHGDPVRSEGVLCWYHFGWSLLDDMREAGFQDATVELYWSERYGYLGAYQILLTAQA